MPKFKSKSLFQVAVFCAILLFFAAVIPASRSTVINFLTFPLKTLIFVKRQITGIVFYNRFMAQNEILKKENDLLRHRLNETAEILLENKRLASLLAFQQKSSYNLIAARVIGHSSDSWSSLIIIDKGTRNGVKKGYAVINYLGLLGRVIETSSSTSKIMLMNDPNIGVSALVQRSRQEGLITGTLGGSLIMKYLPNDADITISDEIITSGLTETYPKGLLIGSVVAINSDFSGLSLYAIVKPAVNLSSLEEVLVVIP